MSGRYMFIIFSSTDYIPKALQSYLVTPIVCSVEPTFSHSHTSHHKALVTLYLTKQTPLGVVNYLIAYEFMCIK